MATMAEFQAAKAVLKGPPVDVLRARFKWTVIYKPIDPKSGIKAGIHGRFDTVDEANAAAMACHEWFNSGPEEVVLVEVHEPKEVMENEFDDDKAA